MKKIVILGAGTAGSMAANRLARLLPAKQWKITIVDEDPLHYYQAGFLFIPFGSYDKKDVIKNKGDYIPDAVEWIRASAQEVNAPKNQVVLNNRVVLDYDYLIIASGVDIYPQETPGLGEHEWGKSIHSFYSMQTAIDLQHKLRDWQGGRLVVNVVENPIKCPVAPMEFLLLADSYFSKKGMRDRVELVYATPLSGAFTKPVASKVIGDLLDQRNIIVEPDFYVERVEPDAKKLVSYDEREVAYDLLVSIPLNKGAEYLGKSGLGDALNMVPVNKHTFLSDQYDNIFVLGDTTNAPTSKAGSVAHYAIDHFGENFLRYTEGKELKENFDGHTNCFIESGFGKGILLDFNYEQEPLPGRYPLPGVGPFKLLQESVFNHWGKLFFRWMYWNILMKGRSVPLPSNMTMAGKWQQAG